MTVLEQGDGPLSDVAARYLEALLRGNRKEACRLILSAVEEGTSVKSVYLEVFQPVQREMGRLWQTNEVTVAQEHYHRAPLQGAAATVWGLFGLVVWCCYQEMVRIMRGGGAAPARPRPGR